MAFVKWTCTQCGRKEPRNENTGRPAPGSCPRNNGRPHEWVEDGKW